MAYNPYPTSAGCGSPTEDAVAGLCGNVMKSYKDIMDRIRKKWVIVEPPRDGRIPRIGQAEAQKVINTCARLLEDIGFAVRRNARGIPSNFKGNVREQLIELTEDLCKTSYLMRKPYTNIDDAIQRFSRKLKEAMKEIKDIDGFCKKVDDPQQTQIKTAVRQLLVKLQDKVEEHQHRMDADEARERELAGKKGDEGGGPAEESGGDDDEDDDED